PPVSSRTMSRSAPRNRSALRGDRPTSAGWTETGRRLANPPNSAGRASRPVSGFRCRGALSSAGSRTAPSSTASARVTASRVTSGSGSPPAATPAAPTGKRRSVNSIPKRSPAASSARSASAITSGPIPSPGSTAMEYCFTTFPLSRDRGREDRAEAVLAERPDRVLARRAAAEVLPNEEDSGPSSGQLVELEVRIRAAVGPEAPVVEQGGSEPRALHPLQELLRNDLV